MYTHRQNTLYVWIQVFRFQEWPQLVQNSVYRKGKDMNFETFGQERVHFSEQEVKIIRPQRYHDFLQANPGCPSNGIEPRLQKGA